VIKKYTTMSMIVKEGGIITDFEFNFNPVLFQYRKETWFAPFHPEMLTEEYVKDCKKKGYVLVDNVFEENNGAFNGKKFFMSQPDCTKVFIPIASWKIKKLNKYSLFDPKTVA
jgi:hypothetical protein